MGDYVHPEVLVSTNWVAGHGRDANVRLVEVDVDTSAYEQGHMDGAVGWNWQTQLQDGVRRDILDKAQFEALMSRSGITPETTVVLYGDNNNWFAAYAFWMMKYFRHRDVRLMNGGRKLWLKEGRPLSQQVPSVSATSYKAPEPDPSVRALRENVFSVLDGRSPASLVDVRSVDEFTGKVIAPPGMTETAQRAGHIPKAINVPWSMAANEDGTFKSVEDLKKLYHEKGVAPGGDVIAYCRIGERSSHTWFVLKYLLGHETARNYDGSWTEWGNLIGAPIEKSVAVAAS
jgi:thiosulfate/3-mercaptopyruvate sulfurtransferase